MKHLLAVFLTVLVFLVGTITMTRYHESAHQQIYANFGVDSNVELDFFGLLGGKTVPGNNLGRLNSSQYMVVGALQAANEVYGYQVFTVLVCVLFFSFILLMFFEHRFRELKRMCASECGE